MDTHLLLEEGDFVVGVAAQRLRRFGHIYHCAGWVWGQLAVASSCKQQGWARRASRSDMCADSHDCFQHSRTHTHVRHVSMPAEWRRPALTVVLVGFYHLVPGASAALEPAQQALLRRLGQLGQDLRLQWREQGRAAGSLVDPILDLCWKCADLSAVSNSLAKTCGCRGRSTAE